MPSPETFLARVESVVITSSGPAVMLARKDDPAPTRLIPIFIDQGQALNIQLALDKQLAPRPMTHDLFSTVLNELGAVVEKVVIEELAQSTFYASLYVQVERGPGAEVKRFDARPSDGIALAVRSGAPIYVARDLLDTAGIDRKDMAQMPDTDVDPNDVDLGVEP